MSRFITVKPLVVTLFAASLISLMQTPIAAAATPPAATTTGGTTTTDKAAPTDTNMPWHMCGSRMMQRMDANNDGKVSKEEFVKAHEKMFVQMDTNHDDVLNQDELGKKCERWREGMGTRKGMGPGMNPGMNMEPPAMNQPAK